MRVMNNLKSKFKKANKDNKGFSLVELIIVIAIMAILVGIVGTQVIPYIDKSRKAKDVQVLSGLCTDAVTAYSSNAAALDPGAVYTITIGSDVTVEMASGTGVTNDLKTLKDAFNELNSITKLEDLKLESKSGKAATSIVITCQNANPMVKVETTTTVGSFDEITSK